MANQPPTGKRRFLVKTRGKLYSPTAHLPQNTQVAGLAFGSNQTFLREEEHDPIVIEQLLASDLLEVTDADTGELIETPKEQAP